MPSFLHTQITAIAKEPETLKSSVSDFCYSELAGFVWESREHSGSLGAPQLSWWGARTALLSFIVPAMSWGLSQERGSRNICRRKLCFNPQRRWHRIQFTFVPTSSTTSRCGQDSCSAGLLPAPPTPFLPCDFWTIHSNRSELIEIPDICVMLFCFFLSVPSCIYLLTLLINSKTLLAWSPSKLFQSNAFLGLHRGSTTRLSTSWNWTHKIVNTC